MPPYQSKQPPDAVDLPNLLELERLLRADAGGEFGRALCDRIDRLANELARRTTLGGTSEQWCRWQAGLQACSEASRILAVASRHYSQEKARI